MPLRSGSRSAATAPPEVAVAWPAVIVTDAEGRVTHWNGAAECLYGWTADEAYGRPIYELNIDPTDSEIAADIMRQLALGTGWEGTFPVRSHSGEHFVVRVCDAPLLGPDGEMVGVVGLSVPVDGDLGPGVTSPANLRAEATRARRQADSAVRRLTRLQRIAGALSHAVGPEDVATTILEHLEPEGPGVRRALWLLDRGTSTLELVDPANHPRARAYASIPLAAHAPGAAVARSGAPLFVATREERDRVFPALADLGGQSSSLAVLPLLSSGSVFGVLVISHDEDRVFPPDERRYFMAVADLASEAIERSHLRQRQAEVSRALQASLLPPALPAVPGIAVATLYRPAWAGLEVGGDFYDLFAVPRTGHWAVLIGDVCGTGPAAASLTAQVRHTVRTALRTGLPIAEAVVLLNDSMAEAASDDRFCTVVLAEFAPSANGVAIDVVCAGHPSPLILRADGGVEEVAGTGLIVGAFPGLTFTTRSVSLATGDSLVLHTDGILEAPGVRSEGTKVERFGSERLAQALTPVGATSPAEVVAAVTTALDAFTGGGVDDDVAMLVLMATEES